MAMGQRQYGADVDMFNRTLGLGQMQYGQDVDAYNRQRQGIMDAYNMALQTGQLDYQKALDLVKIGQGAAGQAGQAGVGTGQGIAQTHLARGANQQDFWSGLGALPTNYLMLSQMFGGGGGYGGGSGDLWSMRRPQGGWGLG